MPASGASSSPPQALAASSSSLLLRVPPATATTTTAKAAAAVSSPTPAPVPLPAAPAVPVTAPAPVQQSLPANASQPQISAPQPITQPISYVNSNVLSFSHYPNASYMGPTAAPAPSGLTTTVVPGVDPVVQAHSNSSSPAPPPIHPSHQLKFVSLETEPLARPLNLDHRDGVKTWAMRLGHGEHGLRVWNITYMGDDADESSAGEEEEEEEDEEDMDVDMPASNGKKKGKGRRRGRGKAKANLKALKAARAAKKAPPKLGEIQVKLNGMVVAEKEDHSGEWTVDLPVGINFLEVGEKGGLIWKVYAERLG